MEDLEGLSPEEVQLFIGADSVDSFYRVNDDRSVTFFPRMALDNGTYALILTEKSDTSNVLKKRTEVEVSYGYTFTEDDFLDIYNDPEGDPLTHIYIDSLPDSSRGKLLLDGTDVQAEQLISIDNISNGLLVFVPAKDQSNNDVTGNFAEFGFKVVNGNTYKGNAMSEDTYTVTIDVTPVADGTFTTVVDTALDADNILAGLDKNGDQNGFRKIVHDDLELDYTTTAQQKVDYYDSNGFGFYQPLNNQLLKGAVETTLKDALSPEIVSSAQLDTYNPTTKAFVVKYEALIYLEANKEYVFDGNVDDSLVINLGGKTVYEQHDVNASASNPRNPLNIEPFIPEESGFYSLDMYHLNARRNGELGIKLNGQDLTTDHFLVYPDETALEAALATSSTLSRFDMSTLQGSVDGKNGYYTIEGNNIGEAGSWFDISNLSIKSASNPDGIEIQTITGGDETLVMGVDKDGHSTPKLEISGLPAGYKISDGDKPEPETFESITDIVDITDWDRANLQVFAPLDAEPGREGIVLITSSEDGTGNITKSYTHLHISISKDSANYSGTTSNDTITLGTPDKPGTGDNVLFGGSGNDKLDGGAGNDVLFGDSAGGVRGGGFEYWDFSAFGGNVARQSNSNYAWLIAENNGRTDHQSIGAWNIGGRSEDYKSVTRDYNNLEFANPNKGTSDSQGSKYTAPDAGSWVLDMEARQNNELDIWQNVTTMPGEKYNIEIVVSDSGDTTMHVQWGGNTIGILEEGTTNMVALNKVSITKVASGVTGYSKYLIEVAGDREAEFTELRILGHAKGNNAHGTENGRILASVDLKPVGDSGDDTLIGGEGNDILYGQGGDDILWGGIKGGAGDGSTDTFVYSFNKDNGKDIIKDFEVGIDRIYLTDVLDAYRGLSMKEGTTTDRVYNENNDYLKHITRTPGTENDGLVNSTVKSDDNLTIKDFRYDNNNGDDYADLVNQGSWWSPKWVRPDPDAEGQYNQYITVEGKLRNDGSNDSDVVINFGSGSDRTTGKDAYGSVTLEGVKYGIANDGNEDTYGSIEELFGYNGHEQILWATTDGFHIPEGKDYSNLTNMDMTVTDLKIDGYHII